MVEMNYGIIRFFRILISSVPIIFASCATVKYNEAKYDVMYVSHYYDSAKESYGAGDYNQAIKFCDFALKNLFLVNRDSLKSEELDYYDRLMDEVCRLRLKSDIKVYPEKEPSDFPVVFNERVEKWLNFYTGGGKEYFEKWLERSGNYMEMIKGVLRENKMPEELACVPIVESGSYPFAVSRANAVGLWQFIKPTGELFGLEKNNWFDERRDPGKSTQAAVKFMKQLYDEFGDWYLVLASYNGGRNRVIKAAKEQKTDNFWDLYLPEETENYVAKIIATIMITRDPLVYGFKDDILNDGIEYDVVDVYGPVDLKKAAKITGVKQEELIYLNPELMRQCTPPDVIPYPLKLPKGTSAKFVKKFSTLPAKDKYLSEKELQDRRHNVIVYKVRRGDCLSSIARKYKTSVGKIRKWNNIARAGIIYPGQKLKIYR